MGELKPSETLSLDDVADALLACGFRIDRRNLARALEAVPVPGVEPSPRRGVPWRVPRRALVDVFAACLLRRAVRELAPHWLTPPPLDHYRLDAAALLLEVPRLAPLVPRAVARRVEQRAEARAEAARRRRAEEAASARRAAAARAARYEAERRRAREFRDRLEREEWERRADRAYRDAMSCAVADYRADLLRRGINAYPPAPGWREHHAAFLADWPRDRPGWWLPPPGMVEYALEHHRCGTPYGWTVDDWRRWVPRYVPGRPWPWRR